LDEEEVQALLSQNVIPSRRSLGGSRPLAFTEQGISMLSSVLTSDRAIEVNIAIMRTFVRLRQLLATHEDLARRLDQLDWRQNEQSQQLGTHSRSRRRLSDGECDRQIDVQRRASLCQQLARAGGSGDRSRHA